MSAIEVRRRLAGAEVFRGGLSAALAACLVVIPSEQRVPVNLQVTKNLPITIPDQPHGHSETAGDVLLVGRAAEGMFANVTATATTTTYTLPNWRGRASAPGHTGAPPGQARCPVSPEEQEGHKEVE